MLVYVDDEGGEKGVEEDGKEDCCEVSEIILCEVLHRWGPTAVNRAFPEAEDKWPSGRL